MPRFKEVAQRYMKIGDRKFMEGDTVRVVSVSERDALILNQGTGTDYTNGHGMKYIKEEVAKPIEAVEETEEIKVSNFEKSFSSKGIIPKDLTVKRTKN